MTSCVASFSVWNFVRITFFYRLFHICYIAKAGFPVQSNLIVIGANEGQPVLGYTDRVSVCAKLQVPSSPDGLYK